MDGSVEEECKMGEEKYNRGALQLETVAARTHFVSVICQTCLPYIVLYCMCVCICVYFWKDLLLLIPIRILKLLINDFETMYILAKEIRNKEQGYEKQALSLSIEKKLIQSFGEINENREAASTQFNGKSQGNSGRGRSQFIHFCIEESLPEDTSGGFKTHLLQGRVVGS